MSIKILFNIWFVSGVQVKIHTETGVGSRYREGHFKKIDYAKKGDGNHPSLTAIELVLKQ